MLYLDNKAVACACEIQAATFISFDDRRCALAKLAGLKVLEPVAD